MLTDSELSATIFLLTGWNPELARPRGKGKREKGTGLERIGIERETGPEFFIRIGRNSLKSLDSKK
jgi:hypothetical protein